MSLAGNEDFKSSVLGSLFVIAILCLVYLLYSAIRYRECPGLESWRMGPRAVVLSLPLPAQGNAALYRRGEVVCDRCGASYGEECLK